MEFTATTLAGLENVLEKEIIDLGGQNTRIYRRAVSFEGGLSIMYKMNLGLRTALRVLYKIKTFRLRTESDYYRGIKSIPWEDYFESSKTIAVKAVVSSSLFNNSQFAALKAKDALVDRFREKSGSRPDVDIKSPEINIHIHVDNQFVDVSLDSSGEPLFKRGYRVDGFEAPLNEVLAAGMILMTGWEGDSDFIDPMCGSGTLSIEAAMIARNIPPAVLRKSFSFQNWRHYDEELYIRNAESLMVSKDFNYNIYTFDISARASKAAEKNFKQALLDDVLKPVTKDFFDTRAMNKEGLIIVNPPYGERIRQEKINEFYKKIGDHLKFEFSGYSAWILSANKEALKFIGLKPESKMDLLNGRLKCKYQKYDLFKGKRADFISN